MSTTAIVPDRLEVFYAALVMSHLVFSEIVFLFAVKRPTIWSKASEDCPMLCSNSGKAPLKDIVEAEFVEIRELLKTGEVQ